jgi:hypothetical protein
MQHVYLLDIDRQSQLDVFFWEGVALIDPFLVVSNATSQIDSELVSTLFPSRMFMLVCDYINK